MEVSQQDLIEIVERASTIAERLSDRFIPDPAQAHHKLIDSRIKKWCQAIALGNREKFAKRLAWDDLNADTICQVLGNVRFADGQPLPHWAETLREILLTNLEPEDKRIYRCLNPEDPIPFEEVFLPFIWVARQKLITQTKASMQLLSEVAYASLERSLLKRLASICTQCLQIEFSTFRLLRQSSLMRLLTQLQRNNSNEEYQIFIKELAKGGLLSFFQKYSVLARLVTVVIDFWVEATAEFLQRLESDLPIIQRTFLKDTSQVVALEPCLSDPHNQSRSVIALTFASGLKLIYKPKNLTLEVAYFQLLSWCNQQNVLLPFRLLKIINRIDYGWVEYVEHLPCKDEVAAQRHYQRAGMLLCLLYVLRGTDCHCENVIASGEHLVLIDMETLVEPRTRNLVRTHEEMGALALASQQLIEDSVLQVGLLPRWEFKEDKQVAYDTSGLSGTDEQQISCQRPKWQYINTDNMVLAYGSGNMSIAMTTQPNAPSLNGITLSPNDYVDEIINGFQQMYQFLMERREALLRQDSALAALADQRVRFIFRSTEIYGHILNKTLQPKFLQNGADRSIELDVMSRAFLAVDTKPNAWSLLAHEIKALEQLDIPYFTANSSSDALALSHDLSIKEYFKEPSYDLVISNLKQLSDENLARQIAIIRSSLYSRFTGELDSVASIKCTASDPHLDVTAPLTPAETVQEAVAIAKELQQRAIYGSNGSTTWIGMESISMTERLQLQPLCHGLYDGACGVALFLAALSKITGDEEFRKLALGALQDLKKILQDKESRFKLTKQTGLGGADGLGSIVYALTRIGQFVNEPTLIELAGLAASSITEESIAGDRQFDVIAGSGGAILGLLALYQATMDPVILEQATACGYHLLSNRVGSNSEHRAWATFENKLLTGFAHGAAGIAYALLRLYETTQDSVFLEGAKEAIAYERSVFSPTNGNWPDLRSLKPSFMTSWCHGAAGIGLARLGSLMILDTEEIRQEIAIALNTIQQFGLQNLDRLCCGNFGRMEVLLVAALKLSRSDLEETAQRQAAQVVNRAKHLGTFYLFAGNLRDVYNPGFFQGTAGIGYELLRLAYPNLLPSVLLWE